MGDEATKVEATAETERAIRHEAEETVRHLVVCDSRTWEIVPGFVPRHVFELIQGGKGDGGKDKKNKGDKSRINETIDHAKLMQAMATMSENSGANGRATIDTQRELIKDLNKAINERDKTISELQTAITNRDALHRQTDFDTIERVQRLATDSMKKLVVDAQERIAIMENKTTHDLVTQGREMVEKFSQGPIGAAIAKRWLLPATNADAADAGGGGGRGALLRAVSKIGANDVLMEALSDVVGATDWQAAIEYVFSMSEQAAPGS